MSEECCDFDCDPTPQGLPVSPAVLGGGCCALTFVLGAILSIGAVPPLYYGIRYNAATKFAGIEDVYGPGRHFIGPFNTFLLFPSLAQNVEFSNKFGLPRSGLRYPALHTRTKEGLALDLEVSLQYTLKQKDVGKLYAEFNVNYQDMFISTIRDTLIKAAAEYNAYQLWDQRKEVGDNMQRMVNKVLNKTYAECWGLQMLDITLPKAFDDSIVATQVQRQSITTEQFAQEATQIRAITSVIESKFDKEIRVIRAGGDANYTFTTKSAKAELHLSQEDLIMYEKYDAMKLMSNASLYYGFGSGSKVLLPPLNPLPPTLRRAAADDVDAGSTSKAAGASKQKNEL
eukprot:TRINITY_DN21870_c0_g1_i1.p1 TRINITY_DN21870_c0_g1~~TRINITY_DN21870_c0_g1_i1.p1  ORF type:complete len:343 (-),score=79.88 TRINITY_DN21870_c0_g1_i1:36-1064(-)